MSELMGNSAQLCEVQESSGNSDSGLDTDQYLESLIRKQNIPRTQNYNPGDKTSSLGNRDSVTPKPGASQTSHSNTKKQLSG